MAPLSFLKSSSSSSSSSPANPAPSPARSSQAARNSSPSPEPSSTSRYNPARLLRRKASLPHKTSSQAIRTSSDLQPVPALVHGSELENSEHETEGPQTASSAFFSDIGDPPSNGGNGVGLGLGSGTYTSPQGFGIVGEDRRLGSSEDGPSRTFGSPRSKRDGGIWSSSGGGGTVLMDSIPDYPPTQSPNRATFLDNATATPTTPSSRRIMDPAELLMEDSSLNSMSSPGPLRHLGRPATPPIPPLDHPFYPTALSPPRRPMPKSPRPSSRSTPPLQPPQLVSSSSFSVFPPTDDRPRHTSSPSLDSKSISRTSSATQASTSASGASGSNGNGLVVDLQDDPEPDYGSRRPTVTAEWLARKPSSSTSRLGRKNSTGAERISRAAAQTSSSPIQKRKTPQRIVRPSSHQNHTGAEAGTDSDSPGVSQESDAELGPGGTGVSAFPGLVGRRRSISARDGYEVEVSCDDSQWPGAEDETGELVWKVKIRRQPKFNSQREVASNGIGGNDAEQPESRAPAIIAPSSPLQLSSGHSRATAPGTASSINLSLSLDQPTGKMVFIAFPMDLHATPRRRGSNNNTNTASARRQAGGPPTPPLPPSPRDLFSAGQGPESGSKSGSANIDSEGSSNSTASGLAAPFAPVAPISNPSTPPQLPPAPQPSTPQSRSSSRLDRTEYPVTPTRVRLSGQFSPSGPNGTGSGGYTSPRSRGTNSSIARSLSPAFSGTPGSAGHNGYISPGAYTHGTPTGAAARRTRLVTAPDLEGGLYAPGTVDGLSEELETASLREH